MGKINEKPAADGNHSYRMEFHFAYAEIGLIELAGRYLGGILQGCIKDVMLTESSFTRRRCPRCSSTPCWLYGVRFTVMVWRGGGFGGANSAVGTDPPLYEEADDTSASCTGEWAMMLQSAVPLVRYHIIVNL
jgi:hypothetical protein